MEDRKFLLPALVLAALILCVPWAAAAALPADGGDPLPPLHITNISPEIRNSTYMYSLLIPTPYQRQNLFDRIDQYVPCSSDLKTGMKEYLRAIWDTYPVRFADTVEGGDTVTYITFAPAAYTAACTEPGKAGPGSPGVAGVPSPDPGLEMQLITFLNESGSRPLSWELRYSRAPPVAGEPRLCAHESWMLYLIDRAMWVPFEN